MDDNTSEVIEILGFKVTETQVIKDGQTIDNHFNIRNMDGETVSRDYKNIEEPISLLRDLANYLNSRIQPK